MTTTTTTLTDFLLERIAEDEAAAREAMLPGRYYPNMSSAEEALYQADREGVSGEGIGHFERYLPARVLAECAAKRAIIQLDSDTEQPAVYEALRILAAVYADHPDYDDSWRP